MTEEIRMNDGTPLAAKARGPLPGEFAEQIKFLADDPTEAVLWSDVLDRVRGGFKSVRRLMAERSAHDAR